MSGYQCNTTNIDTGQLGKLNAKNNSNKAYSQLEILKKGEKSQRNSLLSNSMDIDDGTNTLQDDNNNELLDDTMNERMENSHQLQTNMKGLSFEMEFDIDEENNHYVATSVMFVSDLLERWIKSNAIEGVLAQDNSLLNKGFDDYQAWAIPPKIIHRKNYVTAEIIAMVKTNESAYALYSKEQDYCQKFNIHVSSKNTIMEYTTKIGFLTGTYVKIAASKYYITDIKRRLDINENVIEVKKEYTYDKGKRSKALVIYATENEAEKIDKKLKNMKSKRYRYLSYRLNTSEDRMGAMHYNDVINIKARYETLIDASLDESIMIESKRQETLESRLMSVQDGNDKLFLAVEQGVGTYENNITVIINPKKIKKAKQWIVNDYPKLQFQETKERKSSINEEQYKNNNEYNEELREFLRPVLESKEAKQSKVFGKSMKSYAQALGIKQYSEERRVNEKKTNEKKRKNEEQMQQENNLKEVIVALQNQVKQLKDLIITISETLPINEEQKNSIIQEVNQMKEIQVPQSEDNVENVKQKKITKKRKDQQNEKEKRKGKSRTPMYQNINEEVPGNLEDYNRWHKEDGIQRTKRKRSFDNNEL